MTAIAARPKTELGVKRRCAACATPFYDLQHRPIRCPKCGAVFNANARKVLPASATKRFKAAASRGGAKKAAVPAAKLDEPKQAQAEDDELEQGSDQDDLILDQEDEDV